MNVGQKASLSLLIAVLLFAAFSVAAFSGLFDVIESRFYNPAVSRGYEEALAKASRLSDAYHARNIERFRAVLALDAVRRSFLPNMSAQDAFDRANALGKLQEETAGLVGLRLLDSNGKRMHFSTLPGDVLRRGATEIVYRNYGEAGDQPYEAISAPESSTGRIGIDQSTGRFVCSLPFFDSFNVYRGSAVFLLSLDGLSSLLVKEGLLPVGEVLRPAGDKGIVLRSPAAAGEALAARSAEVWAGGVGDKPLAIAASTREGGDSYVLFSRPTDRAGYVGFVLPASAFALPSPMKWLLLGSFLVTSYLLAFLLLNIRQDRMAVLSDRIKRFQITLLEESIGEKADLDLGRWRRELESRRAEVKGEIKKSVGRVRKNREAEVEELIDKSWDEILSVLGARAEAAPSVSGGIGVKELERILGEALKNGSFVLPANALVQQAPAARAKAPAPAQAAPVRAPVAAPSAPEAVE